MSSEPHKLLMVGLRGTGKSTFLAALWHTVEADRDGLSALYAPKLQPDREYLNGIRSRWLSFEQVGRTSLRAEAQYTQLTLARRADGEMFKVEVPDLSGESFRLQWANRRCRTEYVDHARDVDGVLLFVHPQVPNPGRRIAAKSKPGSPAPQPDEDEIPWDAESAPTQVQLVDILQILLQLRRRSTAMPVSLIVSAWDGVSVGLTPEDWVAAGLPLLDQFLRARTDAFRLRVFGVSAQGGDLAKDIERLERFVDPLQRVSVTTEEGRGRDLTSTIDWMTDEWRSQ